MNEQDREDVLMIVEAVLDHYLAEALTRDILEEIEQSIKDNWNTLKIIHARKGGKEEYALDQTE